MTKLLKPDFEKDVVYLYQFPRLPQLPCLSPFCVKVEMFLRLYDIPYEIREIHRERSKYGLVPWIELNGEQIADSQLIVERLKEHFADKIRAKNKLSAKDLATTRMISRAIENHTMQVIFKYKVADDPEQYADQILRCLKMSSGAMHSLIKMFIARQLRKRVSSNLHSALGPFSPDEFELLLRKDLDSIRDYLGEGKYLFGNEITEADCTLFAHLSTVYYLDIRCHVNDVIKNEYPTIVAYMENVMEAMFPEFPKTKQ